MSSSASPPRSRSRSSSPSSSSSSSSSEACDEENEEEKDADDMAQNVAQANQAQLGLRVKMHLIEDDWQDMETEREELLLKCRKLEAAVTAKHTQVDYTRLRLCKALETNDRLQQQLKRVREDCAEAEDEARESQGEAEELEREAENARVALQQAQDRIEKLETKLEFERTLNGDLQDALSDATARMARLGELEKIIGGAAAKMTRLAELEKQVALFRALHETQQPTLKRGKLLRDICFAPRHPDHVGLTECYVEEFAAAIVIEPTEACCQPIPPLRVCIKVADVDDAQLVQAVLMVSARHPLQVVMQFCLSPGIWRDAYVKGPAMNGSPLHLSVLPRQTMQGEEYVVPLDVSIHAVRFRDFADEQELRHLVKVPLGIPL